MPLKENIVLLAGNGCIGRVTSKYLSKIHNLILVHHTGSREIFPAPNVEEVIVPSTQLPILSFPKPLIEASKGSVVIHFNCMGELDGEAFCSAFEGIAKRMILISSCDVYQAYGRFTKSEPGSPVPTPINESSPLRTSRYPYKDSRLKKSKLVNWYDKILAEKSLHRVQKAEKVILRLPKVFGEEENANLDTVYGYAENTHWRWTHGYVENIASAITICASHPNAKNEIFNLGEAHTPTMGERLKQLPTLPVRQSPHYNFDFRQDLHVNTDKIRKLLAYEDIVDEKFAMERLANGLYNL